MSAKHQDVGRRNMAVNTLVERIRAVIEAEGGVIPFSRFMAMALYEPDLGYYMSTREKFGARGDFITAPLLSPLFGQTLARSVLGDVRAHPHVIEWGAGNGQLAQVMLAYWAEHGLHPSYTIVDVSPACRAMQRETLAQFASQLQWVDEPPSEFHGVIIANEVLDALPVDLFHYQDGVLWERGVGWAENKFVYVDRKPEWDLSVTVTNKVDYISERHVHANAMFAAWLQMLKAGKLIVIDYGFLADEYYHPERNRGTLMCHYQHQAHDDPFMQVGEQDITAYVNFSALIALASTAQRDVTLYTQAQYLIEHGMLALAQAAFTENIAEQRMISQAMRTLLEPQEMGERVKVLVVDQKTEDGRRRTEDG